MEFKVYKISYYLNAQHSFDNEKKNIHSHTFHISLYLEDCKEDEFIDFQDVERLINRYIDQYNGKYLNAISPFDHLIPTIENISSVFYEDLKVMMLEKGYDLIKIDISENPLRIYSISDRLYLGKAKT